MAPNARTCHSGAKQTRHTYVLSGGLLRCGRCGTAMEIVLGIREAACVEQAAREGAKSGSRSETPDWLPDEDSNLEPTG
jgi:hypothetical protein